MMTTPAPPRTANAPPAGSAGRMSLASVIRGPQHRPIRAIVAGVEGVGKTTFAADAPSPIFLASEDGTAQLDVTRFQTPRNWTDALDALRELATAPHEHKTLVVDSLDWLEPHVWAHVCEAAGKRRMTDFAYGAGMADALDQWRLFVRSLSTLVVKRQMHIVLIAHTEITRIEEPGQPAYDRYQMKLHKKAAALLREWVDYVLFARHEVRVAQESKKSKAKATSSGRRIMHTRWSAAYDAKSRVNLPDPMPLSWLAFEKAVGPAVLDATKLRAEIEGLRSRLSNPQRVDDALRWAEDNAGKLARALSRLEEEAQLEAEEAEREASASRGEEG